MALHLFKRKKKKIEEDVLEKNDIAEVDRIVKEPVKVEKEKVDLNNRESRINYIQRLHESIQEAKRQCGEIKFEYGQVTSYLKDIQLIDQAPAEEKQELYRAAYRIVDLKNERSHIQKKQYKITDGQKRAIENEENKVETDIQKLLEYEDYQLKIKNDLRQLSSEQALLTMDKRDIIRNQGTLKSIGKILAGILVAVGAMLVALALAFKVDITVPFIVTVSFAFVIAAIILNEARKNRIDMVITEKKCNRAIYLGNKVKIKYVNNVRTLDYMYAKYQVRNATELDFVYGQYLKAKREWEKQRESTLLLDEQNEILLAELERIGVRDREIWFAQAIALIDPREMVEIRHELNQQRKKLREQLEYNTDIMQACLEEIEKIRDKNPEYEKEVEQILGQDPTIASLVKEEKNETTD
ncbi:MAG: hypothetical protein J5972_07690 [Eubacterium sp.]|nr:hypothetical protein [Eubacterium sp.]